MKVLIYKFFTFNKWNLVTGSLKSHETQLIIIYKSPAVTWSVFCFFTVRFHKSLRLYHHDKVVKKMAQ